MKATNRTPAEILAEREAANRADAERQAKSEAAESAILAAWPEDVPISRVYSGRVYGTAGSVRIENGDRAGLVELVRRLPPTAMYHVRQGSVSFQPAAYVDADLAAVDRPNSMGEMQSRGFNTELTPIFGVTFHLDHQYSSDHPCSAHWTTQLPGGLLVRIEYRFTWSTAPIDYEPYNAVRRFGTGEILRANWRAKVNTLADKEGKPAGGRFYIDPAHVTRYATGDYLGDGTSQTPNPIVLAWDVPDPQETQDAQISGEDAAAYLADHVWPM